MGAKKVSDGVLVESYSRLGNVWKVGEEVGLCGQSVHERLTRLQVIKSDFFTEEEISIITRFYTERRLAPKDKFGLDDLAKAMNRPKTNICRKAKMLGLTTQKRLFSEEAKQRITERAILWHENNEHPRGMLGKHHTEETRARLSESSKKLWAETCACFIDGTSIIKGMQTKHENNSLVRPRTGVSWKGSIRTIGGVDTYFRSGWEANYARYLQFLIHHGQIVKWEHEPDTYWFHGIQRGCRMFIPDFKVWFNDVDFVYVEVKGWMDQRSKTKLDRMAKYYPEHVVVLVEGKEMQKIEHIFGPHIPGWELAPNKKSLYGFRNGKKTKAGMKISA